MLRLASSWADASTLRLGSQWAGASITLLPHFDSSNFQSETFEVLDAETLTPTIRLKVWSSNWVHWYFGITGDLIGKRPSFEIDISTRNLNDEYATTWRPSLTYDQKNWVIASSAFTPLTTPTRVVFQPDDPLTADTVYFADHPAYRVQDFDDLAASLVADTSGLVAPSALADANGVYFVSPAENSHKGEAGGHNLYGFVLSSAQPTTDGGPKRRMVVDCGIHSGEVLDGWPLEGIIDFYINGVGAHADRIRANWIIGLYFPLTPNGRWAGHYRWNPTRSGDANRDWEDGNFALIETAETRDAILADLGGSIPEVGLSLHTDAGRSLTTTLYRSTALPDATKQNAWLAALDTADAVTWTKINTNIPSSVTGWHATRGTPVCVISEFGTRTTATTARYRETGQRFLEATAIADADGVFYSPASGDLVIHNSTHTHAADTPALSATLNLVTTDSTHAHTAEQPALNSGLALTTHGATHAHTAQSLALNTAILLTTHDSTHGHNTSPLALAAQLALITHGTTHGQTAQNLALDSGTALTAHNATHGHTAEQASLSTSSTLAAHDAAHGHTAQTPALSATLGLTTHSATHGHSTTSPVLDSGTALSIHNTTHAHLAQALQLASTVNLAINSSQHTQVAQVLSLSATLNLIVDAALHAHVAQSPTLDASTALQLQTHHAAHGHSADPLTLLTGLTLQNLNATHGHSSDSLSLSAALGLTTHGAIHAHSADNLGAFTGFALTVHNAFHAHLADNLSPDTALALAIQDAIHAHGAEALALSTLVTLAVDDSLHAHTVTAPRLFIPAALTDELKNSVFVRLVERLLSTRIEDVQLGTRIEQYKGLTTRTHDSSITTRVK